jgi:copper(I)-binding protein
MDLKQPLKAGEKVPVTLTFAGAGTIETQLDVRPAGEMAPGMSHGEGGKPHG